MRLRKRPSPLLLLIIPTLASSLAIDGKSKAGSIQQLANGAPEPDYTAIANIPPASPGVRGDVGTKDAPVDGLDGKPHAGPFVDTSQSKSKKKPPIEIEDLGPGNKPALTDSGGSSTADKLAKDSLLVPDDVGVMDDPNREAPKKGKTGTEGGVTEKDRDRKAQENKSGGKVEKKPDSPKEAPPLPQSEQEKLEGGKSGREAAEIEKPKGAVGLEKPADLPDKPHDIPYPVPPTLPKTDSLDVKPKTPSTPTPTSEDDDTGVIQPFHSFVLALTMILFSEVGDKTFLVAALMAMRHPRIVVFSAAFSALIAMTVLSAVLGHAVPTLLPKRFTNFLAAVLFLVFGAKMLREGYAMSPDEGVGEEMREVEQELEEKEHLARRNSRRRSSVSPYVLEAGRGRRSRSNPRLPAPARSPSSSTSRSPSPSRSSMSGLLSGLNNLLSLLLSPAWVQTFIMTFLGEWGDRSQIATIAMAAGQDYWWVTAGAISGHAVCTAAAVVGGRAIAGKVSMRVVTLGGAFAFIVFGLIYLVEASYTD